MTNRTTRSAWVVSASVVAAASIAFMFVNAAGAADECLAKPKDGARPGQHWYYRLDRTTKRQCWYLRDKDDASPQATAPGPSEKVASRDRRNDSSMPRSTADAYAALSSPGGRVESGAQSPPAMQTPSDARADQQASLPDASPAGAQSAVASRWPDPTAGLAMPAAASSAIALATPDPATDTAPEVSPIPAEPPSAAVSLPMLLWAAFGALAFSGLTGSAIYFARARRRPQHEEARSRWPGWSPPDDAYRLYAPVDQSTPARAPRGADTRQVVDRMTGDLHDSGQEIAQLLARFANQAKAEG